MEGRAGRPKLTATSGVGGLRRGERQPTSTHYWGVPCSSWKMSRSHSRTQDPNDSIPRPACYPTSNAGRPHYLAADVSHESSPFALSVAHGLGAAALIAVLAL